MSWRRFLVLTAGLSVRARFVLANQDDGGPVRYATVEEGKAIFSAIGR